MCALRGVRTRHELLFVGCRLYAPVAGGRKVRGWYVVLVSRRAKIGVRGGVHPWAGRRLGVPGRPPTDRDRLAAFGLTHLPAVGVTLSVAVRHHFIRFASTHRSEQRQALRSGSGRMAIRVRGRSGGRCVGGCMRMMGAFARRSRRQQQRLGRREPGRVDVGELRPAGLATGFYLRN